MSNLTTREEVEQLYSAVGVELRLNDLSAGGEDDTIADCIESASQTIASYTLKWYNTVDLANSKMVRRWATVIACYYLSMRRADGTQFRAEFERIMEQLERFMTSSPPIIPDEDGYPVPVRTALVPTVSSYIVDDRARYRKLRVKSDYSTKPYPGQYGYVNPLSNDSP